MGTPPGSPAGSLQRPMSAMIRSNRSSSRMSMSSKHGGSRASDEDSKTAVKVVVRVRPALKPTDPGYDLIPQRFRGSTCHVASPTTLTVESAQGKKLFVFDRVFGEDVDQEGIWEYLSDSVNSFIEGYNVSILAYGQSGAGKSYTMGTTGPGDQGNTKVMGVVPRAAAMLFEKLTGSANRRASGSGIRAPSRYSSQGLPPADKNWQLKATYVEIYNETLRDLLVDDSIPLHDRPQVTIREDTKGRIILTGLQQININSIDDLLGALNFGSSIRQTDATAVNARSSRSHAVFSLNLVQKKNKVISTPVKQKRFSVPLEAMTGSSESWVTVDSKLHFVDLAGSERLKNTGATGERAREGISINAGLASLGKVISQLSTRSTSAHVSYRDSKLTRLLQDSLGGNAMTYMIACINPAEFHLSETLNTVQYAQRARAIQSKPQIQQTSEDGDKQAIIDRLRAEISFLRDQIRLSERTDRKKAAPQERGERQQEREIELQNQLLDVQENYTALSQRHAKLISEISKGRDANGAEDMPALKDAIGDSAVERLKRSNSFAQEVEQVILEYEKTVQALEASLSTTRSSLANTENNLLERETKLAYMETVNQQLQARLQKAIDRETNNENYLRELEARVDGATSGEEKSTAIIQELRKELARTKESEASCEEYISTLEERLAEAEQEQEMMQREIERLEHVVERQRSIGKLDNLLYELDHIRQNEASANGHSTKNSIDTRDGGESATAASINGTEDHQAETINAKAISDELGEPEIADETASKAPSRATSPVAGAEEAGSHGQSEVIADKLDTVTQELFNLRVEHENTVNEHEDLMRKYEVALKTLQELQDAVDEARRPGAHRAVQSVSSSRPTSFLADAGMNGLREEDGQPSSSRTLSSELSLVGESTSTSVTGDISTTDTSDAETAQQKAVAAEEYLIQKQELLAQEMEVLRRLNLEKEEHMAELSRHYDELQEKHQDTLDYVEELKSEVKKAQMTRPESPTAHVIRRKSSQNAMNIDRANRSFASLRNLVLEYLENQPEVIQNVELNLNAIMTELHIRTERVQALEAEIASTRKEMESKMAIISGLTRERSSLKASSPMDMTMVSSMQNQLLESENTLRLLKQAHASREQELQDQIEGLKASLDAHQMTPTESRSRNSSSPDQLSPLPGTFPITPAADAGVDKELGDIPEAEEDSYRLLQLEKEVSDWKSKHKAVMESAKASESQLLSTITDLEESLRKAQVQQQEFFRSRDLSGGQAVDEAAKHDSMVEALQREVEQHKATAIRNATLFADLERSHANILLQVENDAKSRELTEKELQTHRDLLANMERQLEQNRAAISLHEQGLHSLQESHSQEIEDMLAEHEEANRRLTAQLAEYQDAAAALQEQLAQAQAQHEESASTLKAELVRAETEMVTMLKGISAALNEETDAETVQSQIEALVFERKELLAKHDHATQQLKQARDELESARSNVKQLEAKVGELKMINEETLRELERISEKEKKSSRLVEELEDQLNSNYDQHQAANNRLSALQSERQMQLDEALQAQMELGRELEESRAKIALLESQLGDVRRHSHRESLDPRDAAALRCSDSSNSNLRKSTSHTSLPSPPPAIPLPPLPPGSPPAVSVPANGPSPPGSRHQSRDIAQAQLVEEQEARIRTIEKHLFAEKQLTATLEEALTDLEASSNKVKGEMEAWKKKCIGLEEELEVMRKEKSQVRHSLQAVEEERNARMRVEAERANLEARMAALNSKKKKKSALNCF